MKITKISLPFLLSSMVILFLYIFIYKGTLNKNGLTGKITPTESIGNVYENTWKVYASPKYGFKLLYPPLLFVDEIVPTPSVTGLKTTSQNTDYVFFVKFEETQFSSDKGLAVGVSLNNLNDEINRIKSELKNESNTKLIKETKIKFEKYDGERLDYEPTSAGLEKRAVIIFNNGKYSYSVSSVPEEADMIIKGFTFIPQSETCKDIDLNLKGNEFLKSYCQGDYCLPNVSQTDCEGVDVVKTDNGKLSQTSGKDGYTDCYWNSGSPSYTQCRPIY